MTLAGLVVACGAPEGFKGKVDAGSAGASPAGVTGAGGSGASSGAAGSSAGGASGDPGTGAGGVVGVAGSIGIAGTNGLGGASGMAGATAGATGAAGTTPGTAGAAGAMGAAGTTGAAGATGGAGAMGAAGATGATGAAGTTGATGAAGVAGTTGAAGVNGSAGATGAGGTGGKVVTGACAGKVKTAAPLIASFESGALTDWYEYKDSTASASLAPLAIVSPGANGTSKAIHLSGSGFQGFGAGMGLMMICTDASAFQGITFWAKGTSGTSNDIALQVAIPETQAVADLGDCTSKCYDHPSKKVALTSGWLQYSVKFTDLAQAGFGTPAAYSGIVMALNFVSIEGPSLDFQVDEISFY
ncbi:MAG TPA: carbohydrate binding domain-containing protein [Polyangia bacterium]|nr:carbohydrate binding domain-containing protein [Polyangia bacterium]